MDDSDLLSLSFLSAPALMSAVAVVLGTLRPQRPLIDRVWIAVTTFAVSLGALIAYSGRDPEVSGGDVFGGVIFFALMVGLLPMVGYYAVAYRIVLAKRGKWWLLLVWVVGLVPLYYVFVVVWFNTIDMVGCPPDASGCPF